jgi:hypothetical protein
LLPYTILGLRLAGKIFSLIYLRIPLLLFEKYANNIAFAKLDSYFSNKLDFFYHRLCDLRLKKGCQHRSNLVKDENGDLSDSNNILNRWKNYFSQ